MQNQLCSPPGTHHHSSPAPRARGNGTVRDYSKIPLNCNILGSNSAAHSAIGSVTHFRVKTRSLERGFQPESLQQPPPSPQRCCRRPVFGQRFAPPAWLSTSVTAQPGRALERTKQIPWGGDGRSRKTSCKLQNRGAAWKQDRAHPMAVAPEHNRQQGLHNMRHTELAFKFKELESTQLNIGNHRAVPIVFWI